MAYDIARMRAELQQHISHLYPAGVTGEPIGVAFETMRASDDRLSERTPSDCLIPRNDGNGRVVVDCKRDTASSHAIQEKVLLRIATNSGSGPQVLDFMTKNTPRIAVESKGPGGELWHKRPWDIERLPPLPVGIGQASASHFACNICDSETFKPIEADAVIAWAPWPTNTVVDDFKRDQTHNNFSEQLFLLAYRCLLQQVSHIRGLATATDHAIGDSIISDGYRSILEARQRLYRQILDTLINLKTKYDRRLTGIASLPMVHRVVPVEPVFPIASTSFAPIRHHHVATTVYPEPWKHPNGTINWRHWMAISVESGHEWSLKPDIDAKFEAAQQTMQCSQNSVEWTIDRIFNDGKLSTYGRPESYALFREQYPEATDRIERRLADDIVVEYYERHIGPLLRIG